MLFLKKNKFKIVLISILLIIFSAIGLLVYNFFKPDNVGILYGNRLVGIESYNISNKRLESIKIEFEASEEVKKVSFSIQGKIINFVIDFESDTTLESAQKKTSEIIEKFEDDEKKYFDLQVFITNSEDENFPKIAYKHVKTNKFIWSN